MESLDKDRRLSLLAYWHIQKEASPNRWLLSSPATLRDLYDILLTSNGKAPRELFETGRRNVDPNTRRAWAKQTGSSAEAVDWWAG